MSSESLTSLTSIAAASGAARKAPASAKIILKLLAKLQHGALRLITPDGAVLMFGDGSTPVTLELQSWDVFGAAMRSGDIGFAETFIDGSWKTDNLTGLIALLARNRAPIEELVYGSWWGSLVYRVKHLMNRNSKAGSRKNIHAHYDIGNDFYKLWLDPSMTYSSALYTKATGDNLQLAQAAKYRTIIEQLQVSPGDRVLEIGCGWGGFAEQAARDAGVHVTGLTLSTEQLAYARERLQNAGLSAQADLQLCDYRDSSGQYDAIASIEMFEAVGESYWPSYFECLARNLKQGGRACIQTIVIADELFERYRKGTDFIQQYIFPGGMLPSPSAFERMAQEHGLTVSATYRFGIDYADTLAAWRHAFHARLAEVRAQGFDERFIRTWEFYLCYCEAAFRERNTDVMHFTLTKA
ncbi:cyclopropane-fatty-acyl-phospholipid synthase family protein [Massilia sp. CF038]|uniref:SAM-dependent methyltransferase n=1 Tax=Massilia sp. CF038 TaxID=1881045 RepID=UPI0009108C1E|nr:cyclopropane-fatty-acyl-phospholipid synthase family protein [Massilia sp. CF038]SHH25855.1 cyclopropane-fatty-acyl-phospholipid synthase [Massilia sp. CF038]